jgi:hypothetical protein
MMLPKFSFDLIAMFVYVPLSRRICWILSWVLGSRSNSREQDGVLSLRIRVGLIYDYIRDVGNKREQICVNI